MLIVWYPGLGKSVSGMVERIGEFGVKRILQLDAGSEKYLLFLDEYLEAELTAHRVTEGDIILIMYRAERVFDVMKIELDLSKLQGVSQRIGAAV